MPKIIGYASTVKFIPKDDPLPTESQDEKHGFKAGSHWVDHTDANTIVLLDQPRGQKCAILGGIMASRMKVRGVRGAIVNGRVRDLAEIRSLGFPVSTIVASELCYVSSIQLDIKCGLIGMG